MRSCNALLSRILLLVVSAAAAACCCSLSDCSFVSCIAPLLFSPPADDDVVAVVVDLDEDGDHDSVADLLAGGGVVTVAVIFEVS